VKLGPHVERLTDAARSWVAVAPAVKTLDNVAVFESAPLGALRVWRHYLATQDTTQPEATVNAIIAALGGYRAPGRLVLELWNEAHPNAEQFKRAVDHAHAQGFLVAAGSWGTGDYNQEDWEGAVASRADYLAVHAYWSPGGPTQWNGFRWRQFWTPGQPQVLVTECGLDTVRDGPNGTYVGKPGWKANGLSAEQFTGALMDYAVQIEYDPAVAFAFPFTCGPTPDWAAFDCDPIAGWLTQQPQTTWKPLPKLPPTPTPGGNPVTDFTSPNHDGPRATTKGCVIHATLGGTTSPQREFDATVNWFNNPASQVSAHAVVGPAHQVWRAVRPELIAWHCRASNATWRGIELCKAHVADPLLPEILNDAAKVVAQLWKDDRAAGVHWPLVWSTTSGLAEHREMPTNTDGHQDVGGPFDRAAFLALVKHYAGEDELTDQQKAAVLDDLATIWGFSDKDEIAKNPEQSQNAIRERVIAVKVALGLNG